MSCDKIQDKVFKTLQNQKISHVLYKIKGDTKEETKDTQ